MQNALDAFTREFRKWAKAYHLRSGLPCDEDDLLLQLQSRIPTDTLRQIGAALLNGWIITNKSPGKGDYVREEGRPDTSNGLTMLSNMGGGKIAPCWEYYVQLADYSQLMSVSDSRGLTVRLEDRLMDIAVWAGHEHPLLYVENKVTQSQAATLLAKVIHYGGTGFGMDDPDVGNDPLRKAKYLCREKPQYIALSAIGYQKLFSIEYLDTDNQFRLTEIPDHFTSPLHQITGAESPPPRLTTDSLLLALAQRLDDRVWISLGTGQTAFNVYLPGEAGDSIVLGIYKSGEVWTDFRKMNRQVAERLSQKLAKLNIQVDHSKDCPFWKRGGMQLRLDGNDIENVASEIAIAILDDANA